MKKSFIASPVVFSGLFSFLLLLASCKRNSNLPDDASSASATGAQRAVATRQVLEQRLRVETISDISYKQVQELKPDIQVFIFQQVDDEAKARLWQEKISSIIDITSDAVRRASLAELRQLFTPALYDHGPDNRRADPSLHQWADRNRKLFRAEDINCILLTLNRVSVDPYTGHYADAPGDLNPIVDKPCPPFCGSGPVCYCNQTHYSTHCGTCQNVQCTWQWGCGYGGNEYCNGKCTGYN